MSFILSLPTFFSFDQYHEIANPIRQLQCYLFERLVAILFCPLNSSWIDEAPVHALWITGKGGTCLANAIADRHHVVERLVKKRVQVLRSLLADVNAHFCHGLYGKRMKTCGLAASAESLDPTSTQVA